MVVTTAMLTRAAGVCAAAAGLLFIAAQPLHPADHVSSVATGTWQAVHLMTLSMSVLGLVGVTGLYLRQVRQAGVLGLVGYVLFASFYALSIGLQMFEALLLPSLATESPELAASFLGVISGSGGPIDLPGLQALWSGVSLAYLGGGLLLGIAFFRAAVLPRGAGALLAGGTVASLLALVLPHALVRYTAIPVGLALVWLGAALWSERPARAVPTPAGGGVRVHHGVTAAE